MGRKPKFGKGLERDSVGDEMNSVATEPDFLTLSPKHSWLH